MKGCYIEYKDNGNIKVRIVKRLGGRRIETSTTFTPDPSLSAKEVHEMAERIGARLLKKVEDDYAAALAGKDVTFGKFFEETYLAEVEDHFESTTGDFYVKAIRKHFLDTFANVKLKDIDAKMAQDMIEELNKKKNENDRSDNPKTIVSQTVKRYVTAFRSVINLAVEKRVIDVDPFVAGLHYKKFEQENTVCLDEEDVDYIICDLLKKIKLGEGKLEVVDVVIAIGMLAGLRRGEIVALKWKNFINLRADSLDRVKIDVCRSAHKRTGKPQELGSTKTPTSTRMFTVPEVLGEVLWAWKKILEENNIPVGDENHVICNEDGGMVSIYTPRKWFKGYLAGQELTDVKLHSLRHTFASKFLEVDQDIYLLKELMGHKKISTTEIYLKSFRMRRNDLMKNYNTYTDALLKSLEAKNEN